MANYTNINGETTGIHAYQVKYPNWDAGTWVAGGETVEQFEDELKAMRERSGPRIVWLRNNFNGTVTVFEVNSLGYLTNKGSYEDFYNTTVLPV